MKRRDSRIVVMEALFAWDFTQCPNEELLDFSWLDADVRKTCSKKDLAFMRLLLAGTLENIGEIDGKISQYLRGWELSRINKIDKAILRFSVYSLLFQKELHPAIVINEAVSIADEFGDDDSASFVNAILDNIKKEVEI